MLMRCLLGIVFVVPLFVCPQWVCPRARAADPLLRPGDRLAIVGGTLVERMQSYGALEAELQCRRPQWRLTVRNLGWSGDDVHGIARKRFDGPEDGFARLLEDIGTADPSVVLVAYGFAEASDGADAVGRLGAGLQRLAGQIRQQQRRVVLMMPFALPGFRTPDYDRWIRRCRRIVAEVGDQMDIPVITTDALVGPGQLSHDRLLPSGQGYRRLADQLADRLVGGRPCRAAADRLAGRIAEKNQLFFHRYRPQNETYLFLFRKHEQGNNAAEIPRFDSLVDQADQSIWEAAAAIGQAAGASERPQ
jgi:hypothetical protein